MCQVDANRVKDLERARETMERIEGLQRAVDACVEMCQSDLQDVHEGLEAVEQRLDREAEGLEALMERTSRQLTNTLDGKLQESMGKVWLPLFYSAINGTRCLMRTTYSSEAFQLCLNLKP